MSSFSTFAKVAKVAKVAPVSKKNLPNRVRRGLIESTRKLSCGFAPNAFYEPESGLRKSSSLSSSLTKQVLLDIDYWQRKPCSCIHSPTIGCCADCDARDTCYRCVVLEDLRQASTVDWEEAYSREAYSRETDWLESNTQFPTYISDLGCAKGVMRDGSTWRRKSTKSRPTRQEIKKIKGTHRMYLECE
jgi:hypothetical protein